MEEELHLEVLQCCWTAF